MAKAKRDYKDPRDYIDFMLKRFAVDRYFYLGATVLSLALLFYGFSLLLSGHETELTAARRDHGIDLKVWSLSPTVGNSFLTIVQSKKYQAKNKVKTILKHGSYL